MNGSSGRPVLLLTGPGAPGHLGTQPRFQSPEPVCSATERSGWRENLLYKKKLPRIRVGHTHIIHNAAHHTLTYTHTHTT